jgi:transcriptional regulator with XRE-family HTH domain
MFREKQYSKIRKKNKLTQKAIACHVGKSLRTVARWESGDSVPNEYCLRRLAGILNVSVSEISDMEPSFKQDPVFYNKLGYLGRSIFELSTKTEAEKQELFIEIIKKNEQQARELFQLKKNNNNLMDILNSVGAVVYKKNRELKFNYVNNNFESYFCCPDNLSVIGFTT